MAVVIEEVEEVEDAARDESADGPPRARDGGGDVNTEKTTDELRRAVASLRTRVEEDGGSDATAETHVPAEPPPWMKGEPEEMELKYSNGDVYKGLAIPVAGGDGSAGSRTQRHGFGVHTCQNGDYYEGNWREDVRHGTGKMVFQNGLVYEGEWANDKTWGEGVAVYPNGDKYAGDWRQDHRWGWGLQTFSNGDRYEGEWKDDFIHGKGRYDYKDGGYYEGEYADGLRTRGTYVSGDGNVEYTGQWRGDLRDGSGTFFHGGLYRYTGEWKEDMREGLGKCVYVDGSEYNGSWKDNLQHGKGELKHPNGDKFVGTFRLGEMEGDGTALYDNGDKYIGAWKDGKRCGVGRCVFASGDVYEGEWAGNVREGKGQCRYKNGNRYQGMWKANRRHGYGVCFFKDGACFRGEWEDDCWVQSAADPARTKVFGPGTLRAVAGEQASFGIQAYDEDGNKRLSGDDDFTVRIECGDSEHPSLVWGHVEDNQDGTYIVTYTCTLAGPASLVVTLGADEPVSTSPFSIDVIPGAPSIKHLRLIGTGHREAFRYDRAATTLTLQDSFGNRCTRGAGGGAVTAELTDQSGELVPIQVEDICDGTYSLRYSPQQVGYYRLNVIFNGSPLPECPFSIKVTSAPAILGASDRGESEPERLVSEEPVPDTISTWEKIAAEEFLADGDGDGWDSDDGETETEEERYAREHPDVPVVENLEDLWKVGKVQKAMREASVKKKERELAQITKRIMAPAAVPAGGLD